MTDRDWLTCWLSEYELRANKLIYLLTGFVLVGGLWTSARLNLANCLSRWLIDWPAEWVTESPTNWLAAWVMVWLTDWMIGWWVENQTTCLIDWITRSCRSSLTFLVNGRLKACWNAWMLSQNIMWVPRCACTLLSKLSLSGLAVSSMYNLFCKGSNWCTFGK